MLPPEIVEKRRKAAEYQKAYRQKYPDRVKACKKVSEGKKPDEYKDRSARWRSKNPEKLRVVALRSRLKGYGLSIEEYQAMLEEQNGVCLYCKKPQSESNKKALEVDHDHETGIVRGLLCARCNKMQGLAQDDPKILRAAADNLELLIR